MTHNSMAALHNAQIELKQAELGVKYARVGLMIEKLFFYFDTKQWNRIAQKQLDLLSNIRHSIHEKRMKLYKANGRTKL